ncbi:MAG: DEAD/DEAH box helicase family protein [Isosphaeraceae bacterium]|nr:DEAD/DEAH box helicase family protein [Isosphaeraceae bacterium]
MTTVETSIEPLKIEFDSGALVVHGVEEGNPREIPGLVLDPRTSEYRAEAIWYRRIIEYLDQRKIPFLDRARTYKRTPWPLEIEKKPFPHQTEALEAWRVAGKQGVVVLPTGTGKTHLAVMAIQMAERPSLIVTPTIDLMNQWSDELELGFGVEVGMLGGGSHRIEPLTVTTYDSAYQNVEKWGNRFGLVVFDECHHLPGPTYGLAARGALAPFRLGLTATPERIDNAHEHLDVLIGPIVYRREITQLRGQFLADYRVERLFADLGEEERARYESSRILYREFLSRSGIDMRRPGAWGQFLFAAYRSVEGKRAYLAYREQRMLALAAPKKLEILARLLDRHNGDRVIIFTNDNATVYTIAKRFLVPVITHQTKAKERREVLQKFNDGSWPVVATSKVLNEGVNVPEANVAIILSGSGSVREHVQRLGRILRKSGDKEATLYEVVTRGTVEEFTSNRRRRHSAYESE